MRTKDFHAAGAFDPDTLILLAAALDCAWGAVEAGGMDGELDRELVRLKIASRIMELAEQGFRDETLLAQAGLDAVLPALRLQPVFSLPEQATGVGPSVTGSPSR